MEGADMWRHSQVHAQVLGWRLSLARCFAQGLRSARVAGYLRTFRSLARYIVVVVCGVLLVCSWRPGDSF